MRKHVAIESLAISGLICDPAVKVDGFSNLQTTLALLNIASFRLLVLVHFACVIIIISTIII